MLPNYVKYLIGKFNDKDELLKFIVDIKGYSRIYQYVNGDFGVDAVENRYKQMDFLVENGCNNAQGYFFATPMSALDTEEYLQHN